MSKIAAIAIAAAVAFGIYTFLQRGGIHLPDELAGAARITSPEVERVEEQIQESSSGVFEAHPQVGVYGEGGVPRFVVAASDGRTIETADELFRTYVSGVESSGATVDASGQTSGERDGAEFRCAVTIAPVATGTCLWRDDGTFGVVIELGGDVKTTEDLLYTVRAAVT